MVKKNNTSATDINEEIFKRIVVLSNSALSDLSEDSDIMKKHKKDILMLEKKSGSLPEGYVDSLKISFKASMAKKYATKIADECSKLI